MFLCRYPKGAMNNSFQDFFEEIGFGTPDDNFTLTSTCAASSFQAANGSVLPPAVDIAARVAQVIYNSILVTVASILNALVIFLVLKFKKLRNVSFAIAIQIAIIDCLLVIYIIFGTVNHIPGYYILGVNFCIITSILYVVIGYVRNCLIFVFSFDRFASVFAPFNYPRYSHKIITILCVVLWSLGIATAIIPIPPLLDCYTVREPTLSCGYSTSCKSCLPFFLVVMATHFVPMMFIPVGFFIALYIKGRKIRRQEANMLGLNSRNMSEQEWRATKTFVLLLVGIFVVTFPPIIITTLLLRFGSVAQTLATKLAFNILYLIVITDPIIILKNADVKEALEKLKKEFKDSYCKVHKNNTSNDKVKQVHCEENAESAMVEGQ